MRIHHFALSLLLVIAMVSSEANLAADAPTNLVGNYTAEKTICFLGATGDFTECEEAHDALEISSIKKDDSSKVFFVRADFIFTNGHTCNFEGHGYWNSTDRLETTSEETGCELILIHTPPTLHTVVRTPEQCKEHCGMRANLDAVVLIKKN